MSVKSDLSYLGKDIGWECSRIRECGKCLEARSRK